jgi:hypothetical protein
VQLRVARHTDRLDEVVVVYRDTARAITGAPTLAKPLGSPRLRIVMRVAPAPASSHV